MAKPEIYKEYEELIDLYNDYPALRKGRMTAYEDPDVFIFEKTDNDECFLILVNVRNEQKTANIPQDWVNHQTEDEVTDKDITLKETIILDPYQYLIMKF